MNTIISDPSARAALFKRISDILLRPRATWQQIDAEDGNPAAIYKNYLIFLAAIPAVAGFIGTSLVGISAFGATMRVPVVQGLVSMVVGYALSLAMVYVLALVVNQLAPHFQARRDMKSAFKLVAYGATAGLLGGIFSLLPALSLLGLPVALYSIYLVYTGIPVLMKAPQEKAMGYTAAVIACGVVVAIVVGLVMSLFTPGARGLGGGVADLGGGDAVTIQVPGTDIKIDTKRIAQAGRKLEQAQTQGDPEAAAKAATAAIGAALGMGDAMQALAPQLLRQTLPERLGDLPRTAVEARSDTTFGLQLTRVNARYEADGQEIKIEMKDIGSAPALRMGMVGWANSEVESEDADAIERVYRQGKTVIRERHQKDGSASEVAMLLPNGVLLEAEGSVGVEALKSHVLPISQKVAALARQPA